MAGAIGAHFVFARRALRDPVTVSGAPIVLPVRATIDRSLIAGAALFGIGWGIAGFCPGPALVAAAGVGSTSALVFVGSMLAGMFLYLRLEARLPRR